MSITDAALIAEAVRSAFNGYGRNSKPLGAKRNKANRTRARLPLSIHHKESFVLSTYAGLVRENLYTNILLIDQGYKDDERTGRTIKCRKFVFTGLVAVDDTVVHPAVMVKIDLILDKQPDGETPEPTDIWEVPTVNTSAIGLPNLHTKPRFQFLASRSMILDVYNPGKIVSLQVPLNFTTTYGETTGSSTGTKDILTNSLVFSIRALDAEGALAATLKFTGQARILYTD